MKPGHWSALLTAASVALVLLGASARDSWHTVWGDESTYLAMAESLAEDGDLRFTESDRERLTAHDPQDPATRGRGTVILHRTDAGVAYSKPVLYALLAAPLTLLAGDLGPLLANILLLLLAAWLGWRFLCRLGAPESAALVMVTFVGASVLLPQVGWRMSDLAQAALALAGLVLALGALRPRPDGREDFFESPWAPWLGGALLGLLIGLRLPNALILGTALAALVVAGEARRMGRVALAALGAVVIVSLLTFSLVGTSSPYRAVRSSFDAASGYPVAATDEVTERFATHPTTQRMGVVPNLRPRLSAYATLYFWAGRHSGLLWYFPAVIALLATALRRPDRVGAVLLMGAAASAAFYLIWWPENYFGGASFLGNRYFLATYPLLLLALPRLPGRLALGLSWVIALLVGGSAMVAASAAGTEGGSQSHTRGGLLARAPYESTARAIDGRRDRYWARDFMRFLGGPARVGPDSFHLELGAEPVEVMLVNREAAGAMLLRYRTRQPGLELIVEQGFKHSRQTLDGGGAVSKGSLSVPLPAAWRRHGFWWDEGGTYAARVLRLSLAGTSDSADPARVRFWYGGDPADLDSSFEYRARPVELPEIAVAGSATEFTFSVRNMSPVPWNAAGAFPVSLSYQLVAESGDGTLVEGPRIPLPADLPSGDPVTLTLRVAWPQSPGRYRLRIDLLIEDYAWFAARRGEPLAEAVVELIPSR